MALTNKKYEKFYETTGSGADKIDTEKLTNVTNAWATEKAEGCQKYLDDPIIAPLIYQLQQMQDEIDYLRTEISANKDKTSMTIGTGANQAMAGNTTIPPITINLASGLSLGLEPNIDTINRRYILGVVVIDSSGKSPVKYRGAITLS